MPARQSSFGNKTKTQQKTENPTPYMVQPLSVHINFSDDPFNASFHTTHILQLTFPTLLQERAAKGRTVM